MLIIFHAKNLFHIRNKAHDNPRKQVTKNVNFVIKVLINKMMHAFFRGEKFYLFMIYLQIIIVYFRFVAENRSNKPSINYNFDIYA